MDSTVGLEEFGNGEVAVKNLTNRGGGIRVQDYGNGTVNLEIENKPFFPIDGSLSMVIFRYDYSAETTSYVPEFNVNLNQVQNFVTISSTLDTTLRAAYSSGAINYNNKIIFGLVYEGPVSSEIEIGHTYNQTELLELLGTLNIVTLSKYRGFVDTYIDAVYGETYRFNNADYVFVAYEPYIWKNTTLNVSFIVFNFWGVYDEMSRITVPYTELRQNICFPKAGSPTTVAQIGIHFPKYV